MSNPRVTVDNITDMQIKELRAEAVTHEHSLIVHVCDRALNGDKHALEDIVDELTARAAEQAGRDQTAVIADLIIELQRATSEYQARVAEISARIVDAAKGE